MKRSKVRDGNRGGNEVGNNDAMRFKGRKEQGEWAELCFMTRAKGLGMGVLKPYGDSRLYDVAVEDGGKILRVQVKCTMYRRRGSGYSLNILGPGRKKYPKGSVDFFAVFIIPIDEWYIIPYAAMGRRRTMHVTPGSGRAQWERYKEAWELLRGASGGLVIRACVEAEFDEVEAGL
jgi:PD-(D/E)XK endonuclease